MSTFHSNMVFSSLVLSLSHFICLSASFCSGFHSSNVSGLFASLFIAAILMKQGKLYCRSVSFQAWLVRLSPIISISSPSNWIQNHSCFFVLSYYLSSCEYSSHHNDIIISDIVSDFKHIDRSKLKPTITCTKCYYIITS